MPRHAREARSTCLGVALTILHWLPLSLMVRREERQLESDFGDDWRRYRSEVRRWI